LTKPNKLTQVVDGQTVTLEIVAIDPKFAQDLLDTQVDNRPVKQKTLDGMVRAMRAGKFPFCADPVRLNEKGELEDGEHRMRAIIKSGTTQEMLIAWGLPSENRKHYDSGTARSASDQVKLGLKVPNSPAMTSAANLLIRWEGGLVTNTIKPTIAEQFEYVEKHLEVLQRAVRHQTAVREGTGVATSATAACYVRFHRLNPAEAEWFMARLADGEQVKKGQPLHTLRQALITRHKVEKWTQMQQVYAYVRGWNGERNGDSMAKLQFPAGPFVASHFRVA
jgi:hypothetical protein